ncbi:MAG: hypothetical protein N2036_09405 [Bryobacteraceae bacterium]|nr:hypothetical protein [Bryobacteraceae bacterium]
MAWLWHQNRSDTARERAGHVEWLIQNAPESEFLDWPPARFAPGELPQDDVAGLIRLWRRAIASRPWDPRIAMNAARWTEPLNPRQHVEFLQAALDAQPDYRSAIEALARWCVRQIAEETENAGLARSLVESSLNPELLVAAARQSRAALRDSKPADRVRHRLEAVARAAMRRARLVSPQLEDSAFEPPVHGPNAESPPDAVPPLFDQQLVINLHWRKMRRLAPDAFPDLPSGVAAGLKQMGCEIPQPFELPNRRGPANLIRGSFFSADKESWAALCSVKGLVRLLVFPSADDVSPQTLHGNLEIQSFQMLDRASAGFSWMITPASPADIRRYHQNYGGPDLPPVDHDGIESHSLGKASVILYWHGGRWLRLQGAD